MKKDKVKNLIILLFFIGITILFFTYQIVITFDSSHYLWLTTLLTKQGDFSTWDIARGIIFPGTIRICNILFGHSVNGLLVGMYIYYLAMIFGCYLMYRETIKNEKSFKKSTKWILIALFVVLIAINPIVIGFYHTLLTEFIAMSLAIWACYLSWKWINIDFKNNKFKNIIYTIVLSVFTAIAWQLKQPYVTTVLFPVIIAAIISIIRETNIKNFIQRIITVISCVVFIFVGVTVWNAILRANNVKFDEKRTSSSFLAEGIIDGLNEYGEEYETESVSTSEALRILTTKFFKHPVKISKNYIDNYLETSSIYEKKYKDNKKEINKQFNFDSTTEIGAIGFKIYTYGNECVFYLTEELNQYVGEYRTINTPVVAINFVMRNLMQPDVFIMKVGYILLPILTIISIVFVFIGKRKYNEKYNSIINLICILYTFSFLHIMMHAVTGAIIDRYTIPALIPTMMGLILNIYLIIYRKEYISENNKKLINNNKKGDQL